MEKTRKTLICLVLLLLSSSVSGQEKRKVWSWKSASSKHAAVVKVSTPTGSGTGTLCAKSGIQGLVISASHVTGSSQTATITYPTKKQAYTYKVIAANHSLDVCFLYGSVPSDVQPIPLATKQPSAGEYVEVCGFGGPTGHLRIFWSIVESVERDYQTLKSCVISGDSGGPIISKDGIVGVITGGFHTQKTNTTWDLVYPVKGPHVDAISTVYTQCGVDGYCQPYAQPNQGYNYLQPVPAPTPEIISQPIQKPDLIPIQRPVCPGPCPEIDYKKLVEELLKNEEFLSAIQGPAGKDGVDGLPGAPGSDAVCPEPNYEEIAANVQPFLDPVGLQVLDYEGNPIPVVNGETGLPAGDTSWKQLGDYFKIQLLERDLIRE